MNESTVLCEVQTIFKQKNNRFVKGLFLCLEFNELDYSINYIILNALVILYKQEANAVL